MSLNLQVFARKLQELCAAHKITADVGLKFGNDYCQLVQEKSDSDVREGAKRKLDSFFTDHPGVDPDVRELTDIVGLKNSNADRSWLRHQISLRRLSHVTPSEMAAAAADD